MTVKGVLPWSFSIVSVTRSNNSSDTFFSKRSGSTGWVKLTVTTTFLSVATTGSWWNSVSPREAWNAGLWKLSSYVARCTCGAVRPCFWKVTLNWLPIGQSSRGLEAQYAVIVPVPGAFYGGSHFHLVGTWVQILAGLRQGRCRAIEADEQRIGLTGRLALVTGQLGWREGERRFHRAWAIFVPTPAGVGRGQQEHRGAGGYCGLAWALAHVCDSGLRSLADSGGGPPGPGWGLPVDFA